MSNERAIDLLRDALQARWSLPREIGVTFGSGGPRPNVLLGTLRDVAAEHTKWEELLREITKIIPRPRPLADEDDPAFMLRKVVNAARKALGEDPLP